MTNLELIQKAEKERLAMIVAANKAGDKAAYEKAKASYVDNNGEIIFPSEEKQPETEAEKLDAEIANLEFELLSAENAFFLTKDFHEKQDLLYALKKKRGEA
jgi:hypothetical protein